MTRTAFALAAAALFGASLVAVPAARPADVAQIETGPEVLLSTIRANRRALIAVTLKLTEDDAGSARAAE